MTTSQQCRRPAATGTAPAAAIAAILFVAMMCAPQAAQATQAHRHLLGGKDENSMSDDGAVTLSTKFFQAAGLDVKDSTIFAPSDMAFKKFAKKLNVTDTNKFLEPPLLELTLASLKQHVVPGKVIKAADIPSGNTTLPTLGGKDITVVKNGEGVFVYGPTSKKGAKVLKTDINLGSNVVHVIDKVLV